MSNYSLVPLPFTSVLLLSSPLVPLPPYQSLPITTRTIYLPHYHHPMRPLPLGIITIFIHYACIIPVSLPVSFYLHSYCYSQRPVLLSPHLMLSTSQNTICRYLFGYSLVPRPVISITNVITSVTSTSVVIVRDYLHLCCCRSRLSPPVLLSFAIISTCVVVVRDYLHLCCYRSRLSSLYCYRSRLSPPVLLSFAIISTCIVIDRSRLPPPVLLSFAIISTCIVIVRDYLHLYCYRSFAITSTCIVIVRDYLHLHCYRSRLSPPALLSFAFSTIYLVIHVIHQHKLMVLHQGPFH